jgi:hypothetical protein
MIRYTEMPGLLEINLNGGRGTVGNVVERTVELDGGVVEVVVLAAVDGAAEDAIRGLGVERDNS